MVVKTKRIDPLLNEYEVFAGDRTCGNCSLYKSEPWNTKIGICMQSGGVVCRGWKCNLDADGKLKVTKQRVYI